MTSEDSFSFHSHDFNLLLMTIIWVLSHSPGKGGAWRGTQAVLHDLLVSSEDTVSAPDVPALTPGGRLEGREWRLVAAQFRPLPNWRICGASMETPDFLLYPTPPRQVASPSWNLVFFFPAVPKSFYSIGYISSCLLEELNCGYKHMNVKPPQGPPSSLCLGRYSKSDKAIWPISSAV